MKKILLLVTTFNSLSQAVYVWLRDRGYDVGVVFAMDLKRDEYVQAFMPDVILSPFLKHYIPPKIYERYPTFVFHPGIRGDRGAYSLDYALLDGVREWGGVWLRADELYDGGDIYASGVFEMPYRYKASIYRQEMLNVAVGSLDELFSNISTLTSTPQILNPLHTPLNQELRGIDWDRDSCDEIIRKVYASDSHPGVLDEICGVKCYLFGIHKEDRLRGKPKEILAKRDGAICLGTVDGAVWISHLKEPNSFKLPATYLLKDKIQGIKEHRLPLIWDRSYDTFYEVSVDIVDEVGYLYFNFHNGAMSTAQCIRLKYAIEYLKEQVKVLVLMGGEDFFSNGIHLNILEDSKKQGEDGWANINAINDVISSIIYADEVVTVASFGKNAGAGGVFLGLACDFVVAKEGVVLNPHYKTLGLTGSEYHTYTLPKRVGKSLSQKLLDECMPISANYAHKIGMVDKLLESDRYMTNLHEYVKELYDDDFLWDKQEYLLDNKEMIESHKERELEIMYPEFWEEDSLFHKLRYEFVYKVCAVGTPERFLAFSV